MLSLHRRSAAHWCLQKVDIILIRLVQAADKVLQPWNYLNLHVLQAVIPLSCGEVPMQAGFTRQPVNDGWTVCFTLVLMSMFLPPKVSIRDTPRTASLQTLTGYTSPSF